MAGATIFRQLTLVVKLGEGVNEECEANLSQTVDKFKCMTRDEMAASFDAYRKNRTSCDFDFIDHREIFAYGWANYVRQFPERARWPEVYVMAREIHIRNERTVSQQGGRLFVIDTSKLSF